jgi:hypothetical protein
MRSVFTLPATDLTLEAVEALVAETPVESMTVEYKAKYTKELPEGIAAMANTYGGILLVGVDEGSGVVGVPKSEITSIVNGCYERLEPPWQPEIIPLQLRDGSGKYVVVIRVDHTVAPRPLLVAGHAPIRLHGRRARAGRDQLAALFSEPAPTAPWVRRGRIFHPAGINQDADGTPHADFVVRTGLEVPILGAAAWRSLSDQTVTGLAGALSESPLAAALRQWGARLNCDQFVGFARRGHNRARHANLVFEAAIQPGESKPIETSVAVDIVGGDGEAASRVLIVLDLTYRARYGSGASPAQAESSSWRLGIEHLADVLDKVTLALVDKTVVERIAALAGVTAELVSQPWTVELTSGRAFDALLDVSSLRPIPDATPTTRDILSVEPTIDLRDSTARGEQIRQWLIQMALNAGFEGMEAYLGRYAQIPVSG